MNRNGHENPTGAIAFHQLAVRRPKNEFESRQTELSRQADPRFITRSLNALSRVFSCP